MKYMILMQANTTGWNSFGAMAPTDIKAHIDFMHKLNTDLIASGEFVDAQGLTPPHEAKVISAKAGGGAPIVTDGPFPESKEFLAGYWIVDVKSPERAIALAAFISTAPGKGGAPMNFPVELRPVGVAPQV